MPDPLAGLPPRLRTAEAARLLGLSGRTLKKHYTYTIDDVIAQIASALAPDAIVSASPKMSSLESAVRRADGYGNMVRDKAIFELAPTQAPSGALFLHADTLELQTHRLVWRHALLIQAF